MSLQDVRAALQADQPACFPTETLWALAAKPAAAKAIFALKQRPEGVPLAVGFASWSEAKEYVHATPVAEALATQLPGPLSLVCRRRDDRLAMAAPGLDTLSVRVPDHPLAIELLQDGPLLMTSANLHGQPDPITASDIPFQIPVVGDSVPGTASTVVDCTGEAPVLLREGMVSLAEVQAIMSKG
ncbi:MAG: L-threonylcarbamoyladenylate synthase, partial [Thermoplasmatota archaeon]